MIAMIDYDAGNTCSVMNALKRLDVDFVLSSEIEVLKSADRVIFPGVGHAGAAMEALKRKNLVETIQSLQQPVLGICVGMQLLCEGSEEGDSQGLGIIDSRVIKFDETKDIKVPHMGWNELEITASDPILNSIKSGSHFYFVHSYYVPLHETTIASCTYDVSFSAAVRHRNFWGIQCHAEKSGPIGSALLSNFVKGKLD